MNNFYDIMKKESLNKMQINLFKGEDNYVYTYQYSAYYASKIFPDAQCFSLNIDGVCVVACCQICCDYSVLLLENLRVDREVNEDTFLSWCKSLPNKNISQIHL